MATLSLHVLLSVAAGALSYGFLLLVAQDVGEERFALFSRDWAALGFLLVVGTLASFCATLRPLSKTRIRIPLMTFAFGGALLAGAATMVEASWALIPAVVVSGVAPSLLVGTFLGRERYVAAGVVNAGTVFLKIVFYLGGPTAKAEARAYGALIAAYVAVTFLGWFWLSEETPLCPAPPSPAWAAALTMAAATHLIPNADLLWVASFGDQQALVAVAPVALVTRGIFFLQLIFAQWWLPRTSPRGIKADTPRLLTGVAVVTLLTLVVIAFLRWVFAAGLGWTAPPLTSCLWAGAAGAFAGVFYQRLQLSAVQTRGPAMVVPLAAIIVMALLAGAGGWPATSVHALAVVLFGLGIAAIQLAPVKRADR